MIQHDASSSTSTPSEYPGRGGTRGPGRGCIVVLVVMLVLLLMCCCLVIGVVGLYYASPEFNELFTRLLSNFLVG